MEGSNIYCSSSYIATITLNHLSKSYSPDRALIWIFLGLYIENDPRNNSRSFLFIPTTSVYVCPAIYWIFIIQENLQKSLRQFFLWSFYYYNFAFIIEHMACWNSFKSIRYGSKIIRFCRCVIDNFKGSVPKKKKRKHYKITLSVCLSKAFFLRNK